MWLPLDEETRGRYIKAFTDFRHISMRDVLAHLFVAFFGLIYQNLAHRMFFVEKLTNFAITA